MPESGMAASDLTERHREALRRFRVTAEADEAQRARELEDLRFADPIEDSDQWPQDALNSRKGMEGQGGLPAVPARPALTINKLRQPIQQLQQQQRQARLSVNFAPETNGASEDDAEAFEDIVRGIQADSRAHLARNWAFDRAIKCGRGYYRIETDYVNARSFDLKIVYKRILDQFSVYFYPFCQEPDYSDAEWCFLTEDLPLPEYRRRYPDSAIAAADSQELTALGNEHNGKGTVWLGGDDAEGRTIRIAEYYWFEQETDTLVAVYAPQGQRAVLASELPAGFSGPFVLGPDGKPLRRPVTRRILHWAKLNAVEFLTDKDQSGPIVTRDGSFIPVIPVIADESNVGGHRRYTGVVRPAIHAQRLFNVEASSLAEAVHLGPLAPFIGYAEQFEGYEAWWSQLNTRRFPYLPVNSRDGNGQPLGLALPERNTAEQPIQAIALSLQRAEGYIHDTTGIPAVALGDLDPNDRSGKAILALQKQSELGTSGYIDNLANMSMLLEGKILRELVPIVYDRPGRIVSTQGEDDARTAVMLNVPFKSDPKGMPQPTAPTDPEARVINLKQGEYAVAVSIGKSYTTKREEGAAQMGNLATAAPQLVPTFADLWVGNMDFPGARQIADRLAKAVPPQFQDTPGGNSPQALQAQNSQLQAQLQAASQQIQQIQQLADKNKTDLIKAQMQTQADVQMKQAELQSQEKRTLIQASAQMTATQAKIDAENARTFVDAMENRLSQQLDLHMHRLTQVHEALQQIAAQRHELGSQLVAQQHEAALAQQQAPPDVGGNGAGL